MKWMITERFDWITDCYTSCLDIRKTNKSSFV